MTLLTLHPPATPAALAAAAALFLTGCSTEIWGPYP